MPPSQPHVVIVVADDMGYSDIGCYGGEIATPTLDRLGRAGVRLTRFYNTTRCSPSRASLLTGLHPHQTGIGILASDDRPDVYLGSISNQAARHPGAVAELSAAWGTWASRVGVIPWERIVEIYRRDGKGDPTG